MCIILRSMSSSSIIDFHQSSIFDFSETELDLRLDQMVDMDTR